MSVYALFLLPLLPIFASLAIRAFPRSETVWRFVVATSALTLLGALGLTLFTYMHPPGTLLRDTLAPGLAVDGLTAAVLPMVALLGWVAVTVRPPSGRSRNELRALLTADGALLLLLLSADWDWMLAAWILSFLLPLLHRYEAGVSRRPMVLAGVASSAPLVIGWIALLSTGSPRDLTALVAEADGGMRALLYGLLVAAALIRTGIFPFQTWQFSAITRAGLGLPMLMIASRPAAFLVLRFAVPLAPELHAAAGPWIQALAVWTALWGGLLGLASTRLRRTLAALTISHSGMIFAGLFSSHPDAVMGANIQWLNVGLCILGLGLVVDALEARLGRELLASARGLSSRLPGLATAFLLFGIFATGFPGTLGFIGEEYIVSGAFEERPMVAIGLILATALNGMMLMRVFFRVFMGSTPADMPRPALLLNRERLVLFPLLLLLAFFGLFPEPLLRARSYEVIAEPLRPPQPERIDNSH